MIEKQRGGRGLPGGSTETRQTAARSELDEGDALGRPRLNEEHREMCLGVGNLLACSGRQGAAKLGWNSTRKVVGDRGAWGRIGASGSALRWGDRGEVERRHERLSLRDQSG